jgi:hypothetical protein
MLRWFKYFLSAGGDFFATALLSFQKHVTVKRREIVAADQGSHPSRRTRK